MNHTILTILSLSASGSILALLLFALRPLLKGRVTKTFQYYIWLLVLLRLALPISFDGSIMNRIVSQPGMGQAPLVSTPADSGNAAQGDADQGNEPNTPQDAAPSATTGSGAASPSTPAASGQTHVSMWVFLAEHLTAIWLLGAIIYFGWFIVAYLRFSRRIRRTNVRPHPGDMEMFNRLRGTANVRLACNPYINTPMLIGFLSPCVVIPKQAFAANGMKSDLRHILRHELIHYRRRDLLYKWAAVLVSALHWFNPLMILIRREIGRTCELSCDEAVIRSLDAGRRNDYGETLLTMASSKRLPAGIVTTTMCEEKRQLKERLESIMTFKRRNVFMAALSLVLALSIAGCSMALGSANPSDPQESPAAADTPGVSPSPSPTPADDETAQTNEAGREDMISAYKSILEGVYYDHTFPDGQACDWNETFDISENSFSVFDIDKDGKDELIIAYSNASMAGMVELVYDFDTNTKTVNREFQEFPALAYYDNGIVTADWSHNQGLAGEFWPYTLYQYDSESDSYVNVGMVDAWDRSLSETNFQGDPFPEESDTDGDGIVYYIMKDGEYHLDHPVDGAEYEQWSDSYLGNAEKMTIPFVNLTEENINGIQ